MMDTQAFRRFSLVAMLAATPAMGQMLESVPPARVVAGGSAGIFRISFEHFTDYYDHRVGPAFGGELGVRVWDPYFALVGVHTFEQDGTVAASDGAQAPITWSERWINVGVRRISFGEKVNSYFGFGVSFFRAEENLPTGILKQQKGKDNVTGFFLDLGADFRLVRQVSAYLELEISSANLGGASVFETRSIGGFLLATGLHLYPF